MIIRLNVGGTIFETLKKTVSDCANIALQVEGSAGGSAGGSAIFLDHDPSVFSRTLRVLRGYPCYNLLGDEDVLHQLQALGHSFINIPIPEWAEARLLTSSVHTLDPEQTVVYGDTHTLVMERSVERLIDLELLREREYFSCRVVGVREGWVDCSWVPKWEYKWAILKLKFLLSFCPDVSMSMNLKRGTKVIRDPPHL